MTDIQAEQAALDASLAEIDASLTVKTNAADQLERLKQAVCECLNVTELTPLLLNKLIERIEIGSVETVDGQKQQKIVIIWRFAGEV